MVHPSLDLPMDEIRELCRRYHVKELSVFGSATREDFRPDSDVDFLVEFAPNAWIGLAELTGLYEDLAALARRRIDLVTKGGLRPLIRDEVLESAEVLYAG